MRSPRTRIVLLTIVSGFALDFARRFVLGEPLNALGASPDQQAWQQLASTILSPFSVVLLGPVHWLQQDPDPPPPFRVILCVAYWSLLALGIHQLLRIVAIRRHA
jgi:hypothetical protein